MANGKGQLATARKPRSAKPETRAAIIEGALKLFGEKGYEEATIAAVARAAGVSEATLYEYFTSKEEMLFSIAGVYTQREYERMQQVAPYIHDPREKLRVIIQAYLEFYERNPLYTSVVLLSLKGNRRFLESESYAIVRRSTRAIVEAFDEGVERGLFREELDGRLVRNLVLGFIEHITAQWLLHQRPETLADLRDTIFEMVLRAIEVAPKRDSVELRLKSEG